MCQFICQQLLWDKYFSRHLNFRQCASSRHSYWFCYYHNINNKSMPWWQGEKLWVKATRATKETATGVISASKILTSIVTVMFSSVGLLCNLLHGLDYGYIFTILKADTSRFLNIGIYSSNFSIGTTFTLPISNFLIPNTEQINGCMFFVLSLFVRKRRYAPVSHFARLREICGPDPGR